MKMKIPASRRVLLDVLSHERSGGYTLLLGFYKLVQEMWSSFVDILHLQSLVFLSWLYSSSLCILFIHVLFLFIKRLNQRLFIIDWRLNQGKLYSIRLCFSSIAFLVCKRFYFFVEFLKIIESWKDYKKITEDKN